MERKKNKKGKLILSIFLLNVIPCIVISQIRLNNTKEDSLIMNVVESKFKIYFISRAIDSTIMHYYRESDPDFCVAEKGQNFNKTDLRKGGKCNRRIVFFGKSLPYNGLNVLLYETDHGGGPGKSCDIFFAVNGKIKKIITLDVNNKATNIIKLKEILSNKKYSIEYSVLIE